MCNVKDLNSKNNKFNNKKIKYLYKLLIKINMSSKTLTILIYYYCYYELKFFKALTKFILKKYCFQVPQKQNGQISWKWNERFPEQPANRNAPIHFCQPINNQIHFRQPINIKLCFNLQLKVQSGRCKSC